MKHNLVAIVALLIHVHFVNAVTKLHSKPGVSLRGESRVQLEKDYPFYHTSQTISAELLRLSKQCKGADITLEQVADQKEPDVRLEVITVRGRGVSKAAANRVMLVSGEHAREIIGPESTLKFLEIVCGEDSVDDGVDVKVADVLQNAEFLVVVNANPRSRLSVDAGEYCKRANPNDVDLNRNWDEHWTAHMTLATDRGKFPFSEPESRIVREVAEKFQPMTYLSIHSGTMGMYIPWAYSVNELARKNQCPMMQILRRLDAQHCRCPFGAAGKEVGYPCPGTSVDYIYDKLNASYSFAFEIWASDPEDMRQRWNEKIRNGGLALLQDGNHLGHDYFRSFFEKHPSEFTGMNALSAFNKNSKDEEDDPVECFTTFNPTTRDDLRKTASNWASVYLELTAQVTKNLKSDSIEGCEESLARHFSF